jgi:hypothetical protein
LGVVVAEYAGYLYFTVRAADAGVELARSDLILSIPIIVSALILSAVGGLIASKRPRNPIGWLFALIPAGFWLKGLTDGIAYYAHFARRDAVPGGAVAAWMSAWDYIPAIGAFAFVLLLFPDGRLPSRRWAPVAWIAVAGIAVGILNSAFLAGPLGSFADIRNPYPAPASLQPVIESMGFGFVLLPLSFVAGVASLVVRARSGSAVLREQVKWIAFAGAFFAVGFVSTIVFGFELPEATLLFGSVAAIGVASAFAITRYRLFDIDRLISRTLSYATVTAFLGGMFVFVVLVPTALVGSVGRTPDWLIAIATLVVAALFRPVRRRVQSTVDRRFNRGRYDAVQTIDAFTARLRDEVDMDTLKVDLETLVHHTMEPAHISLWLRDHRPTL